MHLLGYEHDQEGCPGTFLNPAYQGKEEAIETVTGYDLQGWYTNPEYTGSQALKGTPKKLKIKMPTGKKKAYKKMINKAVK